MSDTSRSIIPAVSNYRNKEEKAIEITKWLIDIKAIGEAKTDCTLGADLGYPMGKGAAKIVDEPEFLQEGLITNGLDVVTERTVFHTGGNGLDNFICPKCEHDLEYEGLEGLDNYIKTGDSKLACPNCKDESDLNEYKTEPTWGFSDLGFTFWNWPDFNDEFLKEFESKLGCDINVVVCHL